MPRVIVPKIEREAKIFGPFTFKQFIFVGSAGAILFIFYFMIPFLLWFLMAIFLISLALILAFGKVGGRSLHEMLLYALIFFFSPKIYIWKRKIIPPKIIPKEKRLPEGTTPPKIVESKLKKLSARLETRRK